MSQQQMNIVDNAVRYTDNRLYLSTKAETRHEVFQILHRSFMTSSGPAKYLRIHFLTQKLKDGQEIEKNK